MRKIKLIIVIIILLILIPVIVFWQYLKPFKLNITWNPPKQSEEFNLCLGFVENKMYSSGKGIYTNFIDKTSLGDETRGHDILSESEGLALLIYVQKGDKDKFSEHFNIIKEKMLLENHLVSWRVNSKNGSKNKTSATIDDLRIVKALLLGYDRWGDFRYRKEAVKLAKAIKNNSVSNNKFVNFNDSYTKSTTLDLAYIDLYTVKILSKLDKDWNEIYAQNMELLEKGFISKSLPLYKKSYNLEKNSFSEEKDVEVLYSMLVAYHKQQAGEDVSDYMKWMKETLQQQGNIYSKYNIVSKKPVEFIESTAIYAIGLSIAKSAKDEQLVSVLEEKLKKYQVKDKNSEIYGAFGNSATKDVYSFDNLEALLAWIETSN